MAAKRILMACALAMVFGATGCRHWCETYHPCPAPAYAAPAACPPCYQQPVSYAPVATYNGGGRPDCSQCTCVPR